MSLRTFLLSKEIKVKIRNIKLIVSDVDGVLTNGQILFGDNLSGLKSFNVKDGLATKELLSWGINIALISGGESGALMQRAKSLSIKEYYSNIENKLSKIIQIQEKLNIDIKSTLYIGDDINDLQVLPNVSLFVSPQDAHYIVRRKSDLVLRAKGGEGAFRELSDLIKFFKNKK